MKHRIKSSILVLACLVLAGSGNLAYAKGVEESPFPKLQQLEEGKKGSITIQVPEGEETKGLEGVRFTVTQIGNLKNGSYELLPEYASAGINLNELKNADEMEAAAEKLEETRKEQGKEETGKTLDASGKLTEKDLDVGVYLVSAKETEQSDLVSPTLASIPAYQNGEMNYDVTIEPKHTKRPPEKTAPQTGLFPKGALLLFAGGFLICGAAVLSVIPQRRKSDEKK